jgi:hypothetical protein
MVPGEVLYEIFIQYELWIKIVLIPIVLVLFVFSTNLLLKLVLFLGPFNKFVQNSVKQFEIH